MNPKEGRSKVGSEDGLGGVPKSEPSALQLQLHMFVNLKSLYDTIFIVAILFYSMNPASSS